MSYFFHASMSRQLGVSGYGLLVGLLGIITLLSIPAVVAQAMVAKTISGYVDGCRADRIRNFVRHLAPWAVSIAILAAICFGCGRFVVADFLHASDVNDIWIVSWSISAYLILPLLNGILQGEQRFRALALCVVCDQGVRAVSAVALVFFGYGVRGALISIALGATCAVVLALALLSKVLPTTFDQTEESQSELMIFAHLRASGGLLVISCLASIDILLVKHFRTAHEAGLFSSLVLVGRIVYLISNFVPTILLPKAAENLKKGASPLPLLVQGIIVLALTLSTIMIPLLLAPAMLLRLVAGNAYTSAAPLLAMYGTAIAFLAAAYAAANYNIGVSRLGFAMPVIVIGFSEVLMIDLHHQTLQSIIWILAIGHGLIFLATTFRIWEYKSADQGVLAGAGIVQTEM